MTYRMNYGNGQVSRNYPTLKAVREAKQADDAFALRVGESNARTRIQKYVGADEWVTVKS
jgi:hypothetical protein